MTNDEVERAIEHILNNQANFEVQLEKTNQQIARTNEQLARTDEQLARTDEQLARTDEQLAKTLEQVERTSRQVDEINMRLDHHAETQTQLIQIMTIHLEKQGEINASIRASMAHTDKRLDALIDIVREGRGGQS